MSVDKFDKLFDSSKLPKILSQDRTLSKEECRSVYNYMQKYKPEVMFEFGVFRGCSTSAFLQISKWIGIDMKLHSWDILDNVEFVSKKDFSFHLDNVVGREQIEFDKYNPNLVFLDAHPYTLTKNIINICISKKINFMCHDVALEIGYTRAKQRSCNFTKNFDATNVNWELFILGELFSKTLFTEDFYEDDKIKITCYRDHCGLAIAEFKQ